MQLAFCFLCYPPPENFNFVILSAAALFSIITVGTVHNNLILGTGCIALAWGAHLGWNLVFMDSNYTWAATGRKLTEPEIFNANFGYTPILVYLKALMVTSLLIFVFPGK